MVGMVEYARQYAEDGRERCSRSIVIDPEGERIITYYQASGLLPRGSTRRSAMVRLEADGLHGLVRYVGPAHPWPGETQRFSADTAHQKAAAWVGWEPQHLPV